MAVGAPSLTFPFGHDQALYYYVGREWVLRGAIPYLHSFDHKTPGLYILHGLLVYLFGEQSWSIRLAELACVAALGICCAYVVVPRGERPAPGMVGAGVFVAAIAYYGLYSYWDTAQSEVWYSTFCGLALWAALRCHRIGWGAGLAGALLGAALVMKPTAMAFGVVVLGALVWRGREETQDARQVVSSILSFALGTLGVLAPVLGYFALHGASDAMRDILVGANAYYVEHERGASSIVEGWGRVIQWGIDVFPMSLLALCPFVGRWLVREPSQRRAFALASWMTVAGLAAVAIQMKFYALHFAALLCPMTMTALAIANRMLPEVRRLVPRVAPILIVAALFAGAYSMSYPFHEVWYSFARMAVGVTRGRISHEDWAASFHDESVYFSYPDIEHTGLWILSHSQESDRIAVRGFNPGVYAIARRHYGGRFFWTNFLVDPRRAYRRADYTREELDTFERIRPRYVVTLTAARGNIDAADFYVSRGYSLRVTFGGLQVLERVGSVSP